MPIPPIKPPGGRKAAALAVALAIAAPAEGLRQVAYRDPGGILTVCYGHTGPDVDRARTYGAAECRALLTADMRAALEMVDACVPGLPDAALGAFADAVYNLGPTVACDPRRSTAARLLRSGDIVGACGQLPRWNKIKVAGVAIALPGLTDRRTLERDTCWGVKS